MNRLTFRSVFDEFAYSLLNLEQGFFNTLWQLTLQPGHMCRNYVLGKRRPYVKPLQFYLIMLTLYFLVSELTGINPLDMGRDLSQNFPGQPANHRPETEQVLKLFNRNIKVVFTLLLVIIASAQRIVYRRSGYNFIELLAAALFIVGYSYLFSCALILLAYINSPLSKGTLVMGVGLSALSYGYLIWAIYQFFDRKGFKALMKAFWAFGLAMMLYGLVSVVATLLITKLGVLSSAVNH